jgi:hypothetical protein
MKKRTIQKSILKNLIVSIILLSMITTSLAHTTQPATPPVPLSPTLTQEWVAKYNGYWNGVDQAKAIGLDEQGNIYITGSSLADPPEEGQTYYDIATIKYNNNGEQQWAQRWENSQYHLNDFGSSLVVDADGNSYVTGKTLIGTNEYNIVVIKYNTDGVKQWEDFYYGGFSQALDYPEKIILDGSGNLYVTGSVHGQTSWTLSS